MTTWLGTRVRSPICAGWRDSPLARAGPAVFDVPPVPFSMPRPFFNIKTVTFWAQMPQCRPPPPPQCRDGSVMGADAVMLSARPFSMSPGVRLPNYRSVASLIFDILTLKSRHQMASGANGGLRLGGVKWRLRCRPHGGLRCGRMAGLKSASPASRKGPKRPFFAAGDADFARGE